MTAAETVPVSQTRRHCRACSCLPYGRMRRVSCSASACCWTCTWFAVAVAVARAAAPVEKMVTATTAAAIVPVIVLHKDPMMLSPVIRGAPPVPRMCEPTTCLRSCAIVRVLDCPSACVSVRICVRSDVRTFACHSVRAPGCVLVLGHEDHHDQ